MPRGKDIPPDHMFVADFETCDTDHISQGYEYPDQRVWLAGLMRLSDDNIELFTDLTDFMKNILRVGDNQHIEIAFHNLKFDGSFIVPWLLNNGWLCTETKPGINEFSVLIDERNAWYSITIQVSKRKRVTIWDSLKLYPVALAYLPDIYGTKTRKIMETQEFYTRKRSAGYLPDNQEIKYLYNDVKVLAEVLQEHIKHYGLKFKKTQASQAWYDFTQHFPAWKLRFPALDDNTDSAIRSAYWGGISYVNTSHASKDLYDIGSYDINSSYPDKAAHYRMPYGSVIKEYENRPADPSKFWVAEMLCSFELKKNCLPCIPLKSIIDNKPITSEKWLRSSDGVVKIVISSIDFGTAQLSYDIKVYKWVRVLHWAQKLHKELTEWVEVNNLIKVENKKAAKLTINEDEKRKFTAAAYRAKINNNSWYGKFGESIIKEGKYPIKDDENGNIMYRQTRKEIQPFHSRKYLPVAIAITAWGRRQLVTIANALGEYNIYQDTDSVYYLREGGQQVINDLIRSGNLLVDDTQLGAWAFDGKYFKGRFLRSKCYMLQKAPDSGTLCTVAGLPADKGSGSGSKQRKCLNWDNFHIGYCVRGGNGKMRSYITPTGTKLIPVDFVIREVDYSLF